jgi:ABC-2 type transport system permease protein
MAADPRGSAPAPAEHAGPARPAEPTRRGDARIHNIGYRSYSGPRLGRGHGRRALFEHSLRGAFGLGRSARAKVMPAILFVIMALPAVAQVAVALTVGMDELPLDYSQYTMFMMLIIMLYIALAAPGMVSLDLRYHTVPLYFSRPLERTDYVAAKLMALSAALFVFVAIPLLMMYAGALLGELGFADQTKGLLQGLLAAAVFAVLHAAISLLVASFTPRRGFGVAAVIAVLTVPYFATVATQEIFAEQGSREAVTWIGLFSPGTLIDGFQGAYLGGETYYPDALAPAAGGVGLLYPVVITGLTALCTLLLLRRYRNAGI